MGYLNDFVYYGECTECNKDHLIWTGLSLLGTVLGRKIWFKHGDLFTIYPSLYICLVGDAGSGKSTAKNFAKELVVTHFPKIITSASFQSHQDIIDTMANMEPVTWKDEVGHYGEPQKIYHYRPFYIIANEFASLFSTDKKGMTEFLTDIYDEKFFSTGFKTRKLDAPERKQSVENPFISILACAIPKWFMSSLKLDLFEGGLGRRLIIVYGKKTKDIPFPVLNQEATDCIARVVAHLKRADEVYGRVYFTEEARVYWATWYMQRNADMPDDPILTQFYQSKHIQVLKIAIILSMTEYPFSMKIEKAHLQMSIHLLGDLEKHVQRLTSGVGRNVLAGYAMQIVDALEVAKGFMDLKRFKVTFFRSVNDKEWTEILNHLNEAEQIKLVRDDTSGVGRDYIFSPTRYLQYLEERKSLIKP